MKNTILLLLAVCLLLNVSCSDDFLKEKKDYTITSSQAVFSDPKQAEAIFAEIYWRILGKYSAPVYGADPLMRQSVIAESGGNSFLTEELQVTAPSGATLAAPGLGNARYANTLSKNTTSGNHIGGTFYWNAGSGTQFNDWTRSTLYPTVYIINQYITEIKSNSSTYPQAPGFWDHLQGQSIFARAWLYLDAVLLWGGLPYYTTDEDVPTNEDRSPRLSIDECIDKICADFKKASTLLPDRWDADNYGRFTSVAALAMISRARLFAASPVFNASWDNTGSKRWQAALEASLEAKQAADAAGYTGVNSINEWDAAFYTTASAEKEGIIVIPKSGNSALSANYTNKWESFIRPASVAGNNNPGVPAPKLMVDLFPLKDGKRATDKNGNSLNGYDAEKFFLNRDPRFYRTFAFSGCEWPGTTQQIWLYAYKQGSAFLYTDGTTGTNAAKQKSKAIVWKASDANIGTAVATFSNAAILEYRYAELLLNIAECYAAKGDIGQAVNYLNQVRSRVGASSVPTPANKYEALEACLYERRVELAYEGKRSWDTRRWLLYEGGAGFDPVNANNTAYDPNDVWGQGWKLYDGKDGRAAYTKTDNVVTKLGLNPISGTKHIGEIWGYDLTSAQTSDPLANLRGSVPAIKRNDDAGRDAKLAQLATFYANLTTVNPATQPGMDVSYGMDSNNGTGADATNFRFTWRGWFNVWPIHYNQRVVEANNDWIEQTVGWNVGNIDGRVQDGTWVYCTPEE
ncbi:MAG: RagB/SusD family nutrient uptake outer membrane protein [Candidatus Symbiothrix sp.]|nr:RagB/SusD family nutrient uptake outer membrane protein [Candidatus Symbiothrix sp.]